jgi:hypothetical protein
MFLAYRTVAPVPSLSVEDRPSMDLARLRPFYTNERPRPSRSWSGPIHATQFRRLSLPQVRDMSHVQRPPRNDRGCPLATARARSTLACRWQSRRERRARRQALVGAQKL